MNSFVDLVISILFEEETPESLISEVRPDYLVKGEDWKEKGVVGRDIVESYGGRIVLAPLVPGMSTTDVVRRVRGENDPPPEQGEGG